MYTSAGPLIFAGAVLGAFVGFFDGDELGARVGFFSQINEQNL